MIQATRRAEASPGLYRDITLDAHLARAAERYGDRLAIVEGDVRLTYAALAERVARVAAGFARIGVQRGDVVTIILPNWWESVVAIQAALRIGAIVNPVVPIYRGLELRFILNQAKPALVVIPHVFRNFDYARMMEELMPMLHRRPRIAVARATGAPPDGYLRFEFLSEGDDRAAFGAGAPTDVSLLLYTSGTTADPKGVLHTHQTLDYEIRSIAKLFDLDADDTVFAPSPLTHITGYLFGVLMPAMLGSTAVCLDVWNPEVAADLIEANSCRFVMAATPFLQGLVDIHARRGTKSALKTFLCGGADVPPTLIRRARDVMGTDASRIYGSSEFPTFCTGRSNDAMSVKADTDGMPIGPVQMRLDEISDGMGELLIKGPDLFVGYLDAALNAECFTDDGYFRTGDLARIDAQGAVTICGRSKDIINRGGEKISAKQVEDLLYQHEMVAQVAVTAIPDPILVERMCAFVVPKPGCKPALDDLANFLDRAGLARQKFPERLELLDSLPMTASGKVQKFKLREKLASQGGSR
ncbi:MAG TPA: AMP-binding protein [Alphaproteobacteria bacterium]|nr:AMP-binding protein [Alphaproteobacteria bacterium]